MSQHRKSTMEKKIIPPLLQGFEPATFQSRVRRSNHWAIFPPPEAWDKFVTSLLNSLPVAVTTSCCITIMWKDNNIIFINKVSPRVCWWNQSTPHSDHSDIYPLPSLMIVTYTVTHLKSVQRMWQRQLNCSTLWGLFSTKRNQSWNPVKNWSILGLF